MNQEWLDKHTSSADPDCQNQNFQQPNDFKKGYDKPVSSKGKGFVKQLSYSADSQDEGAVGENHLKQGRYRPSAVPDQPSTQHTDSSRRFVGKSNAGPAVSIQITLPNKPTSHNSVDCTYDHLPDLPQLLAEEVAGEDSLNSSYRVIGIEGDTAKEVGKIDLKPLTTPRPSLTEPRRRSDAMSSADAITKRKEFKTHRKSLDTGLSDHETSRATSASGTKDPVSRKHLSDLLALPPHKEAKERSSSHSDLDQYPENRAQCRNSPSEPLSSPQISQLQASQVSAQSPIRANVDGSWTCAYCTNIVFNGEILCDVCGHHNPSGTRV